MKVSKNTIFEIGEEYEGIYCMKCRKKTSCVAKKLMKLKGGKAMVKGECDKCGTTVCRFCKLEQLGKGAK